MCRALVMPYEIREVSQSPGSAGKGESASEFKSHFSLRRSGMFIVASGHFSSSSVGATCDRCLSYGARGPCATLFYPYAAPTALSNVVFARRIKEACAPRNLFQKPAESADPRTQLVIQRIIER